VKRDVFTYRAKHQAEAIRMAQADASQWGIEIVSSSWEPGQWGCAAFLLALVLCLLAGLGILVFLYLLIVKPAGQLSVIFEGPEEPMSRFLGAG